MRPTYSKVGVTRYYRGSVGAIARVHSCARDGQMTSLPQTITT